MRSSIILAFLFLSAPLSSLLAQEADLSHANSLFREAVRLIDEGEYDDAWDILERAREQYPEISAWKFEMGYIRMAQERYRDALKLFRDIVDAPEANARYYSMLGNAYDLTGDPEKAIETYEAGIEKFPDAGELYLELGVMQAGAENYSDAIATWETGLTRDPSHPSNYFHASRLFLPTEVRGWGMMYGEIFLNLEPGSDRSNMIRAMLWEAYDDAVTSSPGDSDSSTNFKISFWKDANNLYASDSGIAAPFSFFFEKVAILPALDLVGESGPSIRALHDFRVRFIDGWYNEKNRKAADFYNVTLFDYHRRLIEAGHFMAYNVLVFFNEATQKEARAWIEENPNGLSDLAAWVEDNPYPATANPFSRLTLELMPTIPLGGEDSELEGAYDIMVPPQLEKKEE